MDNLFEFLKQLPDTKNAEKYGIYPSSINNREELWVFMLGGETEDLLIAAGNESDSFKGEVIESEDSKHRYIKAELNHENAAQLRKMFPFTAPIPVLRERRSFGVGDRLGIATPGHIRVFREYDTYPIFSQQSIRELNLTNRTYEDVMDSASFAVFRDGYKDGFGADGDHLKKEEEIEYALGLGFTMITLDCSDHIRNNVTSMSYEQVKSECVLTDEIKGRYLNKSIQIEDETIEFSEEDLMRNVLTYGKAIDFAVKIYNKYFNEGGAEADFEISIDETETPTLPMQHYFVSNELILNNVNFKTVAPRFCGEFQKGVDYIGDLEQFEKELKTHAAIARHFDYKLSIHSGSDKFSTFELIGKYTNGNFHVKTAGTNWLEAMRAIAKVDPDFYRQIHKYALSMFDEAKKFYHVTTDLTRIPDVDSLKDDELVDLFTQNDARQLIHITYGFILNHKDENDRFIFKNKLYTLWRKEKDVYAEMLYKHIGHHMELLYKGFQK
jgi:hypothetical protein